MARHDSALLYQGLTLYESAAAPPGELVLIGGRAWGRWYTVETILRRYPPLFSRYTLGECERARDRRRSQRYAAGRCLVYRSTDAAVSPSTSAAPGPS